MTKAEQTKNAGNLRRVDAMLQACQDTGLRAQLIHPITPEVIIDLDQDALQVLKAHYTLKTQPYIPNGQAWLEPAEMDYTPRPVRGLAVDRE